MPPNRKRSDIEPPREAVRAELEQATEILFKAWGNWYSAPPAEADRAKMEVEAAERKYRQAQKKLEAIEGEEDPATR